jgi:hypothetical protein
MRGYITTKLQINFIFFYHVIEEHSDEAISSPMHNRLTSDEIATALQCSSHPHEPRNDMVEI